MAPRKNMKGLRCLIPVGPMGIITSQEVCQEVQYDKWFLAVLLIFFSLFSMFVIIIVSFSWPETLLMCRSLFYIQIKWHIFLPSDLDTICIRYYLHFQCSL